MQERRKKYPLWDVILRRAFLIECLLFEVEYGRVITENKKERKI